MLTLKSASVRAILAMLALIVMAVPGFADSAKPYDAAAFEVAQKEGKSILIDVYAPWGPTCQAQAPIIEKLAAQPEYKDVVVFRVDFDNQTEALKQLNARTQSTLIAFKGAKETGRSAGDTKADSIEALIKSAL